MKLSQLIKFTFLMFLITSFTLQAGDVTITLVGSDPLTVNVKAATGTEEAEVLVFSFITIVQHQPMQSRC